jgi:hypothetical protein
MKNALMASSLIALASLTLIVNAVAAESDDVHSTRSNPVVADAGEVRAVDYYQHQQQCATVPHFADQVTAIGTNTGDPEKDTFAYPVKNVDTVCATNPTQ